MDVSDVEVLCPDCKERAELDTVKNGRDLMDGYGPLYVFCPYCDMYWGAVYKHSSTEYRQDDYRFYVMRPKEV